jgi:hypothetical protein
MAGTGLTLLFSVIKNNEDEMIPDPDPENDQIDNHAIFSMFTYRRFCLNPILRFNIV